MTKIIVPFTIDKNISFPDDAGRSRKKYPFDKMEVGDSFFVADGGSFNAVRSSSAVYGSRHGMTFRCRVYGEGLRCWRIA